MNSQPISRRAFIGTASLALPVSVMAGSTALTSTAVPGSGDATPNFHYFATRKRLTISMWDFSWLLASHPGGAFEDLERRVAEAAERGYNTLRVDCFPSRVLEAESRFEKNWTSGVDLPQWGQRAATFSCSVRRKVVQLADLCRKHSIWLGLDCWDKGHMFTGATNALNGDGQKISAADEQARFTRYGETWARALRLMREDGVLERAVWVAPMNEVPHFGGRHLESLARLRSQPQNEGETQLTRSQQEDAVYRRINNWMGEPIKAELSRDNIPLSYSSLGAEDYGARLTDIYDVVDVHFMPGVITDAEDRTAFEKAGPGALTGRFAEMAKLDLKAYSLAWNRACRRHYTAMLNRVADYHQGALRRLTTPAGKRLKAIITESFGPCFWPDHPDINWDYYKRYNADALRLVAAVDFKGASLSNYAEPIFSLWDDEAWHWTSNCYFQAARPG